MSRGRRSCDGSSTRRWPASTRAISRRAGTARSTARWRRPAVRALSTAAGQAGAVSMPTLRSPTRRSPARTAARRPRHVAMRGDAYRGDVALRWATAASMPRAPSPTARRRRQLRAAAPQRPAARCRRHAARHAEAHAARAPRPNVDADLTGSGLHFGGYRADTLLAQGPPAVARRQRRAGGARQRPAGRRAVRHARRSTRAARSKRCNSTPARAARSARSRSRGNASKRGTTWQGALATLQLAPSQRRAMAAAAAGAVPLGRAQRHAVERLPAPRAAAARCARAPTGRDAASTSTAPACR